MIDNKSSCRYCNSTNIKTYKKIGNYTLSYCHTCNLTSTNSNVMSESSLVNSEWYSDEYILNYTGRATNLKKRFTQRVHEIEATKKGGNILDLGSGIGLFLESIVESASYNWEPYGVEINKKLLNIAKTRLKSTAAKLYLGSLTSLRFNKNYFDCVTCFDVLEHDSNLKMTLGEIKRILKPSGLLLIQAPNEDSLMAHLCGTMWDWWAVPDHIFHFNVRSLSSILEVQGFKVKNIYTWDPYMEFILNIQGSIRNRIGSERLLGKIIAKYSYLPLLFLCFMLSVIEKKIHIGGLLVIRAEA